MRLFLLLMALLFSLVLFGQDTLLLPSVEINAAPIRAVSVGSNFQKWEQAAVSKLPVQNVANLLEQEAGVFIKNYGLGSLATSSIRGGSAGHTLVLWNGLPLQSPMLGLLDLSLLPAQTSEEITLEKGGNSALWGSGAIGGIVGLNNRADFDQVFRFSTQSSIGSFGQLNENAQITFGNAQLQSVTKFNHQEADNDFFYFISPNLPDRQQSNARFIQQNWMQDLYWKPNHKQSLAFHYWHQRSDRQIPPTNVQTRSLARQEDESHRFILEGKQIGKRSIWQAKVAFFQEDLDYFDEQILLESPSQFRTWMSELTAQWNIKKHHQVSLGSTQFFTSARTTNYAKGVQENRLALFASYRFQQARWQIQSSLRQERVDNAFVPLVPHLGIHYQLAQHFDLNLKISKNYRLPTLNDRFWRPGGNEDLLPESGWSQELGLEKRLVNNKFHLTYKATAFSRRIDNWILWSIREGQPFWSANNISKVWSRGIEQRLNSTYQHKHFRLIFNLGYDYIRSTNQVALEQPKTAVGTQLLYTPDYQAFGKIEGQWKGFLLSYQQQWTSETQGVNQIVPAYTVGRVTLQHSLEKKAWSGRLFFHIHNVWDSDYFIVERRPMPGRYFSGGIHIIFQKRTQTD
ncbi:MAG: TonB-dependent receptor [Bacteroidota bacterium]